MLFIAHTAHKKSGISNWISVWAGRGFLCSQIFFFFLPNLRTENVRQGLLDVVDLFINSKSVKQPCDLYYKHFEVDGLLWGMFIIFLFYLPVSIEHLKQQSKAITPLIDDIQATVVSIFNLPLMMILLPPFTSSFFQSTKWAAYQKWSERLSQLALTEDASSTLCIFTCVVDEFMLHVLTVAAADTPCVR